MMNTKTCTHEYSTVTVDWYRCSGSVS